MFIKRVIIEGFKSYKEMVVLDGFDPAFNAITGFNGSGKSNILDAICFVLGLGRLEVARCQNLRELIYKCGKAGVLSAKVTIEIDNSDQKFNQPQYRSSPTILVSRSVAENNISKFQINDRTCTKETVLEFFQSVKLNIANPHFLIMQGKVVKVSTMKPTEILSMVQEAVGITIYETKRRHNLAKLNKCEQIIKDYKFTMDESIIPKLRQLKTEEKNLREYRTIELDLEKKNKVAAAFYYLENTKFVQTVEESLDKHQLQIEEIVSQNSDIQEQEVSLNHEIEDIHNKLKDDVSEKLNQVRGELEDVDKIVNGLNNDKKLKANLLSDEEKQYNAKVKAYQDFKKNSDKIEKKFNLESENVATLQRECEEKKKQYDLAENNYLALSKGQVANSDENSEEAAASLTDQLRAAQNAILQAEKDIEHSEKMITLKQSEVVQNQKKVDECKRGGEQIQKDMAASEERKNKLQQDMERMNFREDHYNGLQENLRKLEQERYQAMEAEKRAAQSAPRARFTYDRSKLSYQFPENECIGVLCTLFKVVDDRAHKAIEKAVGGRLYDVVCTTRKVAAAILDGVTRHTTVLPLKELRFPPLNDKVLRSIQAQYGEDSVKMLIDCIEYERDVETAMQFVFRDTLLFEDAELANECSSKFNVKTVSYTGEIFSGGYLSTSSNQAPQLPYIEAYKEALDRVKELSSRIQECKRELDTMKDIFNNQYFPLKKQYIELDREIERLNRQFFESPYKIALQQLERSQTVLNETKELLEKTREHKKNQEESILKIEDRLQNFDLYKKKDEEELQAKRKKAEDAYKKCTAKLEKDQAALEQLKVQLEGEEDGLKILDNEAAALEAKVQEFRNQLKELDCKCDEAKGKQRDVNMRLKELQRQEDAKSSEIAKKRKKVEALKKQVNDNNMQIKKLEIKIEDVKRKEKDAKKIVAKLLDKNPWIPDEEQFFTTDDSDYKVMNAIDFDFEQFQKDLKELSEKRHALSRTVNLKASDMSSEQLQELEDIQQRSLHVQKDKEDIFNYLEDVERKKEEEVKRAWRKVSKYFGEIFSTLLPAATCKLQEVTPGSIKDGLQIKVCLSNLWKESLLELSGGQRSLVALSLILALLKFNPAPLYVLDEVDAALDNSHTQNIGIMIKKHFSNSQFIVVSLKEGMFSNANVIFETSFVEGRSYVQRKN